METEKDILGYVSKESRSKLNDAMYSIWQELADEGETFSETFAKYGKVKGFDWLFNVMMMNDRHFLQDMREEMMKKCNH